MKLSRAVLVIAGVSILSGSILAVPPSEATGHGSGAPASSGNSADGANAIKSFKYDAGLKVELFASEPLLQNPVSFTTDERGRWFIAETFRQERGIEDNRAHGNWLDTDIASRTIEDRLAMIHKFYPDQKKFDEKFTKYEDRVTLVEDSNGDGIADKTTIFADGFRDPLDGTGAGILARGNEVWWTCIPNLWRFRDQDGDGKAEVKEKLLTGFGVKFAFRGHDMHGLRFGPDGKLYFSIGDRGIHVTNKEGQTIAVPDTGSIMRCNPDGTGFEVFATGVRNPQELAFDKYGNLFTGDNNSDSGDRARFTYLVEGGDCGWRMTYQYLNDRGPWNRERLWDEKQAFKAKYIIPPIANLSDGPSGLTYNPGTGLSDKYNGKFYLSDFRGGASASVVHQVELEPKGAFFKLKERKDFVKGVLTTDVEFGTDGSLYVLDWVESWGGVNKGRIYKFTDPSANKALQEETKKLIEDGMAKRSPEELATLLGHADMRVRQAAQFELAGRSGSSAVFTKVAQSGPNQLARLHAIWGLGQKASSGSKSIDVLVPLLADGDGEVRAQAAKVLGEQKFAGAAGKLVELLKDKESRVRCFAALSLGKLGHQPAFEPLCQMLAENNDQDPILRHGAVMGLVGCANAQQLASKAGHGSPAVRVGALLALRRLNSPEVAKFLTDGDQSIVLEAARAIHDVPIEPAFPALASLAGNKNIKDNNILSRAINAQYRLGKAENAKALVALAADNAFPEAARKDAIDALSEWGHPNAKDRVLNLWRPLPDRGADDARTAMAASAPQLVKDSPAGVQEVVAKAISRLSIKDAGEPLFQLASNDKASTGARVAAIQALASLKDARLPQIAKLAVTDKDSKVRSEGLQALAGSDPAAAVKVIGDIVINGGRAERQSALVALTQIKSPEAKGLLNNLMDALIAGKAPATVQLDILEAAKRADTPELKDKIAKYQASLPTDDPLAQYRIALEGGDEDRGRKIFREKAEVQCLRCHKNEIGDSQVGPDLTHIGSQKDRLYLLESIVYPNRQIAKGFQMVVVTLNDGNVIVGKLLNEDPTNLQIESTDEQGKPKPVTVPVANIKERTSAPSPMPETTRDFLSKSELRDLVEYLATRK
ncbi:PVC-type heme-binding CxxCH protein [Verrucomicrobiota bacterium sgz303538]